MEEVIKGFNELTVNELYEILALRNRVFIVEQNCMYQDLDYKDQKSYHIYIRLNGIIVSYVRVIPKGISYEECSIGRVLVAKDFRRQGLSSRTMSLAIDFIKSQWKEKSIRISAQAHLVNFYNSLGFKKVSEEYLEDKIPHVEMLYKEE